MKQSPCRITGILIALLGVAFIWGAVAQVSSLGMDYYYFTIGLGIFISGLLITFSKVSGIYIYVATLFVIFTWSFGELWPNINLIAPRIIMPSVIGIYLYFKVRKQLKA